MVQSYDKKVEYGSVWCLFWFWVFFCFFLSGGVWFGWFVVWSRWLYVLIQKKCCLIQKGCWFDPKVCGRLCCCVLACFVFVALGMATV